MIYSSVTLGLVDVHLLPNQVSPVCFLRQGRTSETGDVHMNKLQVLLKVLTIKL